MATKKKIDLVAEIKKAEGTLMGTRLTKLNQLVTAKEEHDKAVKKAHDDELKSYRGLLADFMKRVPYLSLLAEQLSKLAKLPEVPLTFPEKTYIFGAYTYTDLENKTQWGIGAMNPPQSVYGEARYIVVGATGDWITYNKHNTRNFGCDHLNDTYIVGVGSRYYPDSKEFMLAALEWEKQVIALVDSL